MRFENRSVLVTGAAGALGSAVAEAFGGEGARLLLLDVAEEALEKRFGPPTERRIHLAANLMEAESVAQAVAAGVAESGGIDVLCNVAGAFRMGDPVHEVPGEVWRLMLDLNAGSLVNMAKAVVPEMLRGGGGKIVNVGALAALSGSANMGAYIASKSVVLRLTESMAAELGGRGINVNCVLPGTMDTPANRAAMPDVDPGSLVTPQAVAEVILFLASDAAGAVQGATIPVAGRG